MPEDPTVVFLLLGLGLLLLAVELANPGVGISGALGLVAFGIGLWAAVEQSASALGLAVLATGAVLIVAEVVHPSHGLFAALAALAVVIGGVLLFGTDDGVQVWALVGAAVVIGAGGAVAGRFAQSARRLPSTLTGAERFVGRVVTVGRAMDGGGQALVDGVWWNVRSAGAPLTPGQQAQVQELDGLVLVVEPVVSS